MIGSQFMSSEVVDGVLVARIECEKLGEREAQVVQNEITEAAARCKWRLVLDLSQIMLLPSVGLGTIVSLNSAARGGGGKLVVFGLNDELLGVLKLTHLDRLLTIAKNREKALKAAK